MATGVFRLLITGNLGDLTAHLQQFYDDLAAQQVDASPLKAAGVVINFEATIPDTVNNSVATAITNWRTQVTGTSIKIKAEFAVSE